MITEENTLFIIIATLIFMGLMTFLVLFLIRKKIGHPVAEREVNTDSEWTLGTVTRPGRRYNLCFQFQIEYPGGEDDYQLIADYECLSGKHILLSERAGIGYLSSLGIDRLIMAQHNCSLTSVGGRSKYKATVVLCSVGPFDEAYEIRASGRIIAAPETMLKKGRIFLAT